jgi:catechol 2,3-dioxygenase-like lactoylglutathione lyase family enzyme
VKLKNLVPMLGVADVRRSRKFYEEALGMACVNTFERDGTLFWCMLYPELSWTRPDPAPGAVMLTKLPESCLKGDLRSARKGIYFYFYPSDAGSLHSSLKTRGYQVSDLRVTIYRMKEFELDDPDGYQLWFGQPTDEPPNDPRED